MQVRCKRRVKKSKEEIEAYIDRLWKAYNFAREKYYIWIGLVITLSSAIMGFAITSKLISSTTHNKALGYSSLICFGVTIVFGVHGLKTRIERELNCSTGRMSRLLGDPINRQQRKAIEETETIHGKQDHFSDFLFGFFCTGLALLALSDIKLKCLCNFFI